MAYINMFQSQGLDVLKLLEGMLQIMVEKKLITLDEAVQIIAQARK